MPETVPDKSNKPDSDSEKLIYYSDRRPALEDGDYTLTIKQTLTGVPGAPVFSRQQEVSVLGPRFTLDPQDIHSFFPPEGSLGQYSNVLPHVMLDRCSLPWERSAKKTATPPPPWLALLVLDESELNQTGTTSDPAKAAVFSSTLEAMGYPTGGPNLPWTITLPAGCTGWMPTGLASEFGDLSSGKKGTPVSLLRVPWALSEVLLPTAADLPYTVHARQSVTAAPAGAAQVNVAAEPFSAVLATRLPAAGNKTSVFLVSLEGHYEATPTTPPAARVFFVLATWHFACLSATHDFAGLLKNADCGPFCLPSAGLNTQTARDQIDSGFVGLPHLMRQGNRSASWYRGPLLPGAPVDSVALPGGDAIKNADELVHFDRKSGLLDVTYAAAWELGRLLMLSDRRASLDLSHWKEAHSQSLKDAANALEHLPAKEGPSNLAPLGLPESVTRWFNDAQILKGIPANYLIPDDRYLPTESIRFFHLDPLWLKCCLDGAFSVGYVRGVPPRRPWFKAGARLPGSSCDRRWFPAGPSFRSKRPTSWLPVTPNFSRTTKLRVMPSPSGRCRFFDKSDYPRTSCYVSSKAPSQPWISTSRRNACILGSRKGRRMAATLMPSRRRCGIATPGLKSTRVPSRCR